MVVELFIELLKKFYKFSRGKELFINKIIIFNLFLDLKNKILKKLIFIDLFISLMLLVSTPKNILGWFFLIECMIEVCRVFLSSQKLIWKTCNLLFSQWGITLLFPGIVELLILLKITIILFYDIFYCCRLVDCCWLVYWHSLIDCYIFVNMRILRHIIISIGFFLCFLRNCSFLTHLRFSFYLEFRVLSPLWHFSQIAIERSQLLSRSWAAHWFDSLSICKWPISWLLRHASIYERCSGDRL